MSPPPQSDKITPVPPAENGREAPSPSSTEMEMSEADKALVALGYNPVFKREFNKWSSFSFALSISGLYATIITTFQYPLHAGGAAAIVWSWLLGGLGSWFLALSIAEISSAYPTSGAMYFTLKYLVPEHLIPVVAWMDGWLNLIGTVAGTASSEYGAAQMLLSAVSIGTNFAYQPTQGHVVGVMTGLCIIHATINSLSTTWLNRLTKGYAVFHIGTLLAACVALLVLQKDKHDATYVFTNFSPTSGWSPPGFSFLFGCLSPAWIMTNCDATAHIAEEAKDPSRVVPFSIFAASTVTYVVGWLFNIVLVFCMGDPVAIAHSKAGQPVTQLFYNVMGPGPAVFFIVVGFIVMNFVCIPSIQSGSRTLWSFSRDEMLPLSRVWYRIDKRTDTPVIAVWLYATFCVLINLIGLGSYVAIAAVFNICAVALNISYVIPITCKLLFGRFERGPWHLGPLSPIINIWACAWNTFMGVIFLFPTELPVSAGNMNYAVAVLFLVLLFSAVYWHAAGKDYYTGPRTRAAIVAGVVVSAEVLPESEKRRQSAATAQEGPAVPVDVP